MNWVVDIQSLGNKPGDAPVTNRAKQVANEWLFAIERHFGGEELPDGEITYDNLGGLEIEWKGSQKSGPIDLLFSVAHSIPDQEPDVYLMVIDRRQAVRALKCKTLRPERNHDFAYMAYMLLNMIQ